jgi:signal transduction histidine kinase
MVAAFRASWLGSVSRARWRTLAGLLIMLGATAESARRLDNPAELPLVVSLMLVVTVAWCLQIGRWITAGVWLLGAASGLLMLLAPSSGAVIGVISAIVIGALRLPARHAAIAAAVLGAAFLVAYGFGTQWSSLGSLAFTGSGLAFAYLPTASVRRIREERERAEALLEQLQQSRAMEIERAALTERTRIAREIHDVLAHTLSALAVQLEGTHMLVEQRPGDPAAVAAVERAHRLAQEGLAEARRAVGALRGDSLPGPDGLGRLVDDFAAATGTPSWFVVRGDPVPLPSEVQLALYRTAQEALTNVRKHAPRATSVDVGLHYTPDGTELVVEDALPAAVAAPDTSPCSGGYGLVGMRERAELVGGTLEAAPLPSGFRVRLWLPNRA